MDTKHTVLAEVKQITLSTLLCSYLQLLRDQNMRKCWQLHKKTNNSASSVLCIYSTESLYITNAVK